MAARVLGAAAGLRRLLPTPAARTSRLIQPASFVAGRRYASVSAGTSAGSSSKPAGGKPTSKAVLKQLEHIKDPWFLGKYIEDLLAKNKFADALTTVELASKKMEAVVSWNLLIDYQLKQDSIRTAMNTFNNVRPAPPPHARASC